MTVVEIEVESELEDLEKKGCSEPFKFRKLLWREEKSSAITLKLKIYLEFLCTFKSFAKLGKELFVDKSFFQKWCIE